MSRQPVSPRCNLVRRRTHCFIRDLIRLADLRREFETPPYDQHIQEGGQAELRCHPPRGEPEAVVSHWLKDGAPLEADDRNFIQSAAGHLLILQARMQDSANYTCVASNSALERHSPPAEVTVYGKQKERRLVRN